MSLLANLETMLAQGKDNALLRYSLGNEYLKTNDPHSAVVHLEQALKHDPKYSAAWKLLGQALAKAGRLEDALQAWKLGIEVAQAKGDKQAEREMAVFARRVEKQISPK
jgi:predicted Zn-dependent protease